MKSIIIYTVAIALYQLLYTRFTSIGMMPMLYFLAGIAFVYVFYIDTQSAQLKKLFTNLFDYYSYIIYMHIIAFYYVIYMLYIIKFSVVSPADMWFLINSAINIGLFIVTSLLLINLFFLKKRARRNKTVKWINISFCISMLKFFIVGFLKTTPLWLWRWDGVIDLAIIFCWLMIIHLLIDQEFTIEFP